MTTKKTSSKTAKTSKPKKPAPKAHKAPAAKRTEAKPRAARNATTGAATGTVLHRKYKDRDLEILVLEDGYRFEGKDFSSLSALAKHITGYKTISGPVFFKLAAKTEAK